MRHGILKTKFGAGKDAEDMLMRKLAYNFLKNGSMKTTVTKAKVLKQHIDRLVEKMKVKTEANRNILKQYVVHEELIDKLYEQIPAVLGEIKGGYTRIQKLQVRYADGAPMAKITWARPIVLDVKPAVVEKRVTEKAPVKEKKEVKAKK